MLDIKFLRENPEAVKENIRKKFQESKLDLVDQVVELDQENRKIKQEVEELRANRNKVSKQIGALMGQGKKEEAEKIKQEVAASGKRIEELSAREKEVEAKIRETMMVIPNMIDPSVPIGKDDSENVEVKRYGEPVVPDFEIPYHAEIMESFYMFRRMRFTVHFPRMKTRFFMRQVLTNRTVRIPQVKTSYPAYMSHQQAPMPLWHNSALRPFQERSSVQILPD